jgi:hypothetical protein
MAIVDFEAWAKDKDFKDKDFPGPSGEIVLKGLRETAKELDRLVNTANSRFENINRNPSLSAQGRRERKKKLQRKLFLQSTN